MGGLLRPPTISVEIDMNDEVKTFLESIHGRGPYVGAARIEGNELYVIGYEKKSRDEYEYLEFIKNMETGEKYVRKARPAKVIDFYFLPLTLKAYSRYKLRKAMVRRMLEIREKNLAELKDLIKDVKIYQRDIKEVEKELGRPLEIIGTSKLESWLGEADTSMRRYELKFKIGKDKDEADTMMLKYEAWKRGGIAVVDCKVDPVRGTPVKLLDECVIEGLSGGA